MDQVTEIRTDATYNHNVRPDFTSTNSSRETKKREMETLEIDSRDEQSLCGCCCGGSEW